MKKAKASTKKPAATAASAAVKKAQAKAQVPKVQKQAATKPSAKAGGLR